MASIGNDLATIREQQGKTLEDIHDTTKIPLHILQAIEDGSIFTEFDENKTYIRSYIRSYGKALKIADELVVEALDYYELGTYDGQLLDAVDVQDEQRPTFTYDDDADEEQQTDGGQPEASTTVGETTSPIKTEQPDVIDKRRAPGSSPPSVSSVDWADLGRKFTPLENRSPIWIGTGIVLIIIFGVIGYWFYQNSGLDGLDNAGQTSNTTQNLSEPDIIPDSLQLNVSGADDDTTLNTENTTSQPLQALPDTLELLVYAAHQRLEPVRVYSNFMGNFNPYWIEQGAALRFRFTDFIRIRGQYDRMELLLNGHPIQDFEQQFLTQVAADSQYVELQRAQFEADPRWLQPPPDSTQLNFPPPDTVRERPIFPTVNN